MTEAERHAWGKLLKNWLSIATVTTCATLLTVGGFLAVAYADTLESPHYKFDETSVGNGGLIQSNSTNYQANTAIGDTAIGSSTSSNFQLEAGSKTTGDPALSFAVTSSNVTFGSFSPTAASVTTSTFQVLNYTSYGYVVQIVGNPPKNGAHTISPMTTTGASQVGTEQFGINLVANTSPTSVGANPDHGQFGFGSAAPNYDTPDNYRYVSGETIATAPKSSGLTTYTITYLVNVTTLTAGGQYTSDQVLICTGTY